MGCAAATTAFVSVDPDAARETAREILNRRTTRTDKPPRPLRGALEWLGDRLRPIGDFFAAIWDTVYEVLGVFTIVLAIALLVALALFFARMVEGRQVARDDDATSSRRDADSDDPGHLERQAVEAERAGDHATAIRLRFRAGLLRLDRDAGAIAYRDGVGNRDVGAVLDSRDYDHLALRFDEVTYGDDHATSDDTDEAKRRWPTVITEARRD